MAMLEAFVYDPLISWRLLAQDGKGASTGVSQSDNRDHVEAAASIQPMDSSVAGSPANTVHAPNSVNDGGPDASLAQNSAAQDNLPKLVKLKSNTMTGESSQETLNSR
jgi:phosphatidylinositol kinase/protein kinase (PI-3  family)